MHGIGEPADLRTGMQVSLFSLRAQVDGVGNLGLELGITSKIV
jgi:hypothetical protein